MKAFLLLLPKGSPLSKACTRLKGHGSENYAVRQAVAHAPCNQFVLKTDVWSYYALIDHHLLLDWLARHVPDSAVLNLIGQYLRRVAEWGALYQEYVRGLPLGSPLSPI